MPEKTTRTLSYNSYSPEMVVEEEEQERTVVETTEERKAKRRKSRSEKAKAKKKLRDNLEVACRSSRKRDETDAKNHRNIVLENGRRVCVPGSQVARYEQLLKEAAVQRLISEEELPKYYK